MKVKIVGAGSIGNHLAQACRRIGWDVCIIDNDEQALERTKKNIYPQRYGAWDEKIELYKTGSEPKGGFDLIFIGTPPDSHMKLALELVEEKPKILHIEKPLCPYTMEGVAELKNKLAALGNQTIVTIGYDHVVAESIEYIAEMLSKNSFGNILTMDVEFREHWQGIFKAHPWLKGPQDTYLGFTSRGGGAASEHSHALNIWQYFANILNWGRINQIQTLIKKVETPEYKYDSIFALNLITESGNLGRIVQDVVTLPTRKWLRIQGDAGFMEWFCNGTPEGDLIKYRVGNEGEVQEKVFPKKRPDDFYRLVLHYEKLLSGKLDIVDSQLNWEKGIETMEVVKLAFA